MGKLEKTVAGVMLAAGLIGFAAPAEAATSPARPCSVSTCATS